MYLSKITLAPSATLAETLLMLQCNDAYAAHQLLWQLFHQQSERQFIYRQELMPNGLPVFWVLSQVAPDETNAQWQIQTKPFTPQLKIGQRLAFKLRANPTVWNNTTKKRHDVMMHAKHQAKQQGIDTEMLPHYMQQAAQQWLCDPKRLEQWGISLDVVPDIEAYTQHQSDKTTKQKTKQSIKFSSVDYQGVLTIQDPEKFLTQYRQGFGRAKALGCALMLIRGI
ncbi:type I-E CRISPR-associated protein Cas6/Cse3/CasE [Photobacterium leiognathi]|uniref:type I-E CRISPR-associated protein Cas6/Cse3/CasE n=1 Tax=Photobacterium leiognathi TaxID=553611 RepID=UPI0029827432|nr:type I-E CRISPR-associated protein Cas6/Cse3/CasE [Photobacterium leiognathi]